MKRFLCLVLSVLLLVTGVPVYSAAEEEAAPVTISVTAGSGTYHRGDYVEADVSIASTKGIGILVVKVDFDKTNLEFIYSDEEEGTSGELTSYEITDLGDVSLGPDGKILWLTGNGKNKTLNGNLAHLVFKVKNTAPSAEYAITIAEDAEILYADESPVNYTVQGATVSVSCTGHVFGKWQTVTDATAEANGQEARTCTTDEYCAFTETRETYFIAFDANNGQCATASKIVAEGTKYGELPTPTRVGHDFLGWFTLAEGGTEVKATTGVALTASQTLYAHWKAQSNGVTFDPGAGQCSETSRNVTYGQPYGELPTPTRTGYKFDGWYLGEIKIESTTAVATVGAHTLIAKWTANEYTLSYDENGGDSSFTPKPVTFDAPYGEMPTPTRSGYDFDGWYTQKTGGDKVTKDSTVAIANNHTLYAHWVGKTYKVSFNAGTDGSCATEYINIANDVKYADLPEATRTGYSFDGWFTLAEGGSRIKNSDAASNTADITLYAHWTAKTYTVTLDANKGECSEASIEVTYDDTYSALPTPTRTGYDFSGWYLDTTKINTTDKVKITENSTFKAGWLGAEYTVTFNAGDGYVATTSKTVNMEGFYGELPTPTRYGYDFSGWYLGETPVDEDSVFMEAKNTELNAKWTAKTFTLTFKLVEGETCSQTSKTITFGEAYGELPTPEKVGHTFNEWKTLSEVSVSKDTVCEAEGNVTVYATWTANNYTLTLDANKGTCATESKEVTFNKGYGYLPEATREGYKFEGWFTKAEEGTEVTGETLMPAGNVTVYAHWTAKEYTVTLDAKLGTVDPASVKVTYDATYSALPTPVRPGYDFAGWFLDTSEIKTTDTVKITENKTFEAHWQGAPFTVTFNAGEDASVDPASKTVYVDASYGELPTPTRTGYDFKGWYLGEAEIESTTVVAATADFELTAKWQAKEYTVSFDAKSGTACEPINVTYDGTYSDIPETTREGYTFAGWYLGETEIKSDSTVKITADSMLEAHWTANEYDVTFNSAEGSECEAIEVTFDSAYGDLPETTRDGYTFVAWVDAEGNTITSGTTVAIASDHELTATWTANKYTLTFDANKGSCDTACKEVTYDSTYGELPTPTRSGYDFDGWLIGADKIESTSTVKITADTTAKANWKGAKFTATLNANGGSGVPESIDVYMESVYGELPTPTLYGYDFAGWYLGETKVTATDTFMSTEDIELKAEWTAKTFTLTFSLTDGETCSQTSKTITFGEAYGELPTPEKVGHSFTAWKDISENTVTKDTVCEAEGNVTVHAAWTANEYTLSFDANNGTCATASKEVTFNTGYGDLPNATREGYKFDGWFTKAEGGTEVTYETTIGAADTTVYAHWTAKEYTVTLDAKLGTVDPSSVTVTYDATYSALPTPTRDGYIFAGWFLSGSEVKTTDTVKITENKTFEAHWQGAPFTVTFNAGEDASVDPTSKTVYVEASYGELPTPVRAGYDFCGWYLGETKIESGTVVAATADFELSAKWQAQGYTVSFDAKSGSACDPIDVTYDSTYGELPETTRDGYTFAGWYLGETEIKSDSAVKITADSTLEAHWTANKYDLTFDSAEGSACDAITVTFGSAYGDLPAPTRAGYTFAGWVNAESEAVTAETMVNTAAAHQLTATWTANTYTMTFDALEGTCSATSAEATYDSTYPVLTAAERTGYSFIGWFTTQTFDTEIKAGDKVDILDNITLYAKYEPKTFKLTFDPDNGTCATEYITVTYDALYGELPEAERTDWVFAGWFFEDGTQITAEDTVAILADTTVKAVFQSVEITVAQNSYDPENSAVMNASSSMTLSARYVPENASTAKIVWKMKDGSLGDDFASVTAAGVLKAKTITKKTVVTVIAYAEGNEALFGEKQITILPNPEAVTVTDTEGNAVTAIELDKNKPGESWEGYVFVLPEGDASQEFEVKVANTNIASYEKGDNSITLYPGTTTGKTTVTITAKDNSKISAKLNVTVNALAQGIVLMNGTIEADESIELVSGKTLTLTPYDENGAKLSNSAVIWSVVTDGDAVDPYVTFSSGKISVKEVMEPYSAFVRAEVKGNPDAYQQIEVKVLPKAQLVAVFVDGVDCTDRTVNLPVGTSLSLDSDLDAAVYPVGADQTVTWKSGKKAVADIVDNVLEIYSVGTAAITATTADGTKKSGKITINAYEPVESVSLDKTELELASGKSYTFKLTDEYGATVKATWSVVDADTGVESAYASISSGKLSVKTVYADKVFEVTATAVNPDSGGIYQSATATVTVKAADGALSIWGVAELYDEMTGEPLRDVDTGLPITIEEDLTGQSVDNAPIDGSDIRFIAKLNGETVTEGVEWSSSKEAIATIGKNDGVARLVGAGTAKITASYNGKSASVSFKSIVAAEKVEFTEAPVTELASGKTTKLSAKITQPLKPTNSKVDFYVTDTETPVFDEDGSVILSKWATVKSGKLTAAKNLTEAHDVYVTAYSLDGWACGETVMITLKPIATGIAIKENGTSAYLSNQTVTYDINSFESLDLDAVINPGTASDSVTWTSSNPKLLEVDENGVVTLGTLNKAGSASITAKTNDGSSKTCKVTIKLVKTVTSISIDEPKNHSHVLAGGKSLTLKATVSESDATNKKVTWEIVDGTSPYVSLSTSGVLKAKAVSAPIVVTVQAFAADGSGVASNEYSVVILPATTKMNMLFNGEVMTGKTVNVSIESFNSISGALKAVAVPAAANQEFTWKSSNPSVIDVVPETGELKAGTAGLKATTVTITATAKDGTGKTATIKLKLVN